MVFVFIDFGDRACLVLHYIKDYDSSCLGANDNVTIVRGDAKLVTGAVVRVREERVFKAGSEQLLPLAHIPYLNDVIVSCRDDVSLVRCEACTGHVVGMGIVHCVNLSALLDVPNAHLFGVS